MIPHLVKCSLCLCRTQASLSDISKIMGLSRSFVATLDAIGTVVPIESGLKNSFQRVSIRTLSSAACWSMRTSIPPPSVSTAVGIDAGSSLTKMNLLSIWETTWARLRAAFDIRPSIPVEDSLKARSMSICEQWW